MIEYVHKLDKLGRVTLPREIRDKLFLNAGDSLILSLRNREIVISKKVKECIECKTDKNLIAFKDFYICRECINEFIK